MGPSLPAASLDPLLEHPAIWRGRSVARVVTHSTGWVRLDEALPGGGWPAAGLIELLTPRPGLGELRLLLPLLARLSQAVPPRWVAWVSPPFEPYAPALSAEGLSPERQLVIRTAEPFWALEQALGSGACAAVLGWLTRPERADLRRPLRRLQAATQRSGTPAFVFRAGLARAQPSPALLRLAVEARVGGVRLELVKSRGGARTPFELAWADRAAHGRS